MPDRKTKTRAQMRQDLARQAAIDQATESDSADLVDSEAQTIERIQAALSDGGGAHAWLIRVNEIFKTPAGTKEGWAFNADIGEMETLRERIAQECGPGSYRCRVLRDGMPFKQYDLEIRMTMAQRRQLSQPAAPATAAPALAAADGLPVGLARILEGQNKQIEQMAALIAAIANRPAGPTMSDMLAQMKMMQEMMPKPPESDVGFKMFMQAFELAQKIQGEAGPKEGSNMIDLVRDTLQQLPTLLQTIKDQNPAPPMAPPQLARAPQVAPAVIPAAPTPPAAPNVFNQAQQQIERLKAYLLQEAAKGTDPAMCADYAMENMPAELWEALGQVPDPVAAMLQVFPEAASHRAWFEKLIAEFFEAGDDDAPEPGAAANAESVGANRPN
jgi:uncharacterized protein (DUF305 family)